MVDMVVHVQASGPDSERLSLSGCIQCRQALDAPFDSPLFENGKVLRVKILDPGVNLVEGEDLEVVAAATGTSLSSRTRKSRR